MKIPYYQVNAFTGSLRGGNPAGVCVLEDWLGDDELQAIAAENDLSETAYIIDQGEHFDLRWFTPSIEVDLCGHATLASAAVVFDFLRPELDQIAFSSRSGILSVRRSNGKLELDFPVLPARPVFTPDTLAQLLGAQPQQVLAGERDMLVVLDSEATVRNLQPDMAGISRLDKMALMVTAAGDSCDFVSRFFAPRAGIPEDPVTGSSFCTLAPYWAGRLRKSKLHARQVSPRGGEIWCEPDGERVRIAGQTVLYLQGTISWS